MEGKEKPKKDPIAEDIKKTVLTMISVERDAQDKKWGEQNHSNEFWSAILGEEFGEVCNAVQKLHWAKLNPELPPEAEREAMVEMVDEIIQTAAVAVAWVECIERNERRAMTQRQKEKLKDIFSIRDSLFCISGWDIK